MFGLGSVGLALTAVSTISSLLEAAADGINKAVTANQPPATDQTFNPTASIATAAAQSYGVPKEPGVVFPKFDQRTQAMLLAYQEMHRGA
jgi:hypothetical protein